MSTTSHDRASRAWDNFNKGERTDVGLRFTDILRASYPDVHVLRVKPYNCDLKGFAAAGFAEWLPEATIDAVREFSAPGPRLAKDAGELIDDVKFGRVKYNWQGQELVVYQVEYQENPNPFAPPQDVLFVLGKDQSAIDTLLLECGRWTKELHEEIYVFDRAIWMKSKSLYKSVQSATWDDVILDEEAKANLIDDVQGFFDHQELYKSFGVPWKRGIILHGVPGNGKTISIKALLNALSKRQPEPIPSLYVKNFDNCNGGPKQSIQQIFSHARSLAPCVLIFEDLDSMVTNKVRSYFLNEVDGLESNDGILMIGSTNHLDRLDSAITKRPSRFDRKYHFRVPNEHERTLYCQHWHRKMASNPKLEFPEELCPILAKLTQDFSFAYLKELFVSSLLIMARGELVGQQEVVDPESSGSSSSTDIVVVETPAQGEDTPEKTSDQATEEEKATEVTLTKSQDKKPQEMKTKKVIPAVEVPQSLQANKLLVTMKAQAQSLLDEMDNTNDRSANKEKAVDSDEDGDCDSDC